MSTSTQGDLVPWDIARRHLWDYALMMLRTEERRRAGVAITESMDQRLDRWLLGLETDGTVVAYDRAEGFSYRPRRAGTDTDLILEPSTVTYVDFGRR